MGLAVGLVLCRACGPAPIRPTINARMPAWERRNIPDAEFRRDQLQPGRRSATMRWSTSATSISARRRTAPGAPGNDSDDDRHLRDHRLPHPRHGLRQLHQPRHRPRQPARPRGGAAQGARRQPQAADHPVPRRIGADRLHRHAARAGAGRAAAAALLQLPRCRRSHMHYFGCDGMLLPIARPDPAGRRGRRPLSGFLPQPLPARPGAQGQQVVGRGDRARACCATSSSSPSSRSRSASSSAPPWSRRRPSTRATPIPAIAATACSRWRASAAASSIPLQRDPGRARSSGFRA